MQNFPNSPASLHPGFANRSGSMVSSPFPPHSGDPQISPRSIEEYAAMQQQAQANPQGHGQGHMLQRGQQHPGHAAHLHGYGSRNRVAGEVPPSGPHAAAASNPYRKDMDYYFAAGGRDRSRRGGMGYGTGFGYSNMDGQVPHQYRHGVGSASASGMMSPYPLDFASPAASGGGVAGGGSGTGSFSPSQQYTMGQGPSMHSVTASPMSQRQNSQKYPSHQALHQGQPHRSYPLHSHRMPPQFSHYPSGSAGMYNSPPHRYDGSGSGAVDPVKANSSPTDSNPPSSNSTGPPESMGQSYPAGHPQYSPQPHSLHKHAGHGQRNSQHGLTAGYDQAVKMQPHATQAGHLYPKHSQPPVPSPSPAMPHHAPQEVTKSPMNSQPQPAQMQQNFSPISNPSPAASAVQSPSCSSSSSPLMGVPEGSGNPSAPPVQPPPQSSLSHPRGSHAHGRLLQTVPQLSPTAHSNSSVSSSGSSIGGKAGHPAVNVGRHGLANKGSNAREEGPASLYPSCPQEKVMADPGINSLNALTSQVANLPNTVQHMLLTDSLLAHRKVKDGGQQPLTQPSSQVVPSPQSKSQGVTGGDGGCSERTGVEDLSSKPERAPEAKEELGEHFSDGEAKRMRQMSGTSNESDANSYYPPSKSHGELAAAQLRSPSEQSCRRLPLRIDTEVSKKQLAAQYSTVGGVQAKMPDAQTPSSSSPPSVPPSAQPSPSLPPCLPPSSIASSATPSPAHSSLSNCYFEPDAANADTKNGVRDRKPTEIKMERPSKTEIDEVNKKWESITHRGDLGVMHEVDAPKMLQAIDHCKEEMLSPKQNENKEGRSDKGQNFLPDRTLNAAEPQHGGVGVIVSTRPDSNPSEMSKHPDNTPLSPQYGGPLLPNQQNFPDERKFLRDSRSHNGDGNGPVSQYPGQYDASTKPEYGQMPPHLAYKFGNQDATYNACMDMKNRGRMTPTPGMPGNARFQGYNQPQPPFGSLPRKNSGIMGLDAQVRRAMGMGPRPEHNNSAMQQPYPSLLQEVLQGYHLDRRYGRHEQAGAHMQSPNMAQHHYQPRHPYGMIEGMKPHGVSSPAMMGGVSMHHVEMTTGKPLPLNQAQGSGNDMGQALSHPSWDPEMQRLKGPHGGSADKSRLGASPNQSSHMQQPTDLTAGAPPKHINLADYSLPQRKSSCLTSPPSAVQQLLLQDVEPLAGSATPSGQTPMSNSSLLSPTSERRSVICDVSPSRRTPDQEVGQFGTSAASVIQQTFSSPPPPPEQDRKEQPGEKPEVKTEPLTSTEASSQGGEDLSVDATKKKSKCTVSLVDIHSNHQRTTAGSIDLSTTAQHHPHRLPHHSVQNPLMSPQRQQTCSQGLDVSGSPASAYAGYPYSDAREGNPDMSKMHNPAYHGYGMASSQSHLGNKPEGYSHPLSLHHAHDANARLDWRANLNRPTEMMSSSAPEINIPQNQPERKLMSPTDGLTNSAQLPRQQPPYQGAFYDMKMWEAFAARESSGGILEGDASTRTQQPPSAAAPEPVPAQPTPGPIHTEPESPRVEDPAKPPHLTPAPTSVSNSAGNASSAAGNQGTPQVRQFRAGSGEPNPLMMRRRVRSFISPIPAKRLHQEVTQKAGPSSYQSPVSHSDPRYQIESDADLSRSRLPSPSPNSQSPPAQGKTKALPARKGRGLKLEAIVQKITPGVKKGGDYNSHGDSDSNYPDTEAPPYCSDDPDIGARFASPYLGEGQSLDDVLTYRGIDDTGPPPIIAYDSIKESSTGSSIGGALRGLQSDFDFGLGPSATTGSLVGDGDKDDLRIASEFTLLGPLPPAPPLPRPVQGSPPPSSSALSDIQQFTNTYQQLETRRGEQSAANLLRQKLQESGMGFDEYSSSDYYGTSPAHGQGHHGLSRSQVSSPRSGMSMSDTKPPENIVPKGYFPSGKKKGRPVGSVNKQKRAQHNQQPSGLPGSAVAAQLSPVAASAVAQTVPSAITKTEVSACPITLTENQIPSAPTQPTVPAVVKVDVEAEEVSVEVAGKPGSRHKQRKGKDDGEDGAVSGRQRRRRRAVPVMSKEEPDTASAGAAGGIGIFPDKQNNGFSPYIHVERKIVELGAVCTIVNAEEEKMKSGKGSGTDTLRNLAQMARRDKDLAKVTGSRVSERVDSGKTLPSSGYVLSGPVVSETPHTGRLLCCLCQKWANYRHLGDLYGPFYPSDYASKLPKNHPQIKQILSQPGTSTVGVNLLSNSAESTSSDTQTLDTSTNVSILKSSTDSDCTASHATNPTSPATTVGTASPAAGEDMPPSLSYRTASATINRKVHDWELTQELSTAAAETHKPPPEVQHEVTCDPKPQGQHQQPDETQQWPQHRKLTSHPRFKRRHKSGEILPRTIPSNNKASLPFQPPPPSLDSLGPLAQLAQLPQMPLDPEELWVHEGCITWASGVFLVNGKLYGLQETLDGASETNCSHCEMVGATLGCHSKGCTLRYHYICGIEADCSMNEENFSLRCPKHKFSQSSRPAKSIYLEQSERG